MTAISLWEPWATAIAIGAKQIETRGWATSYRGPVAIHAAQTRKHAEFIFEPEVQPIFAAAGIVHAADLSFGCVVATARLVACWRTEDERGGITAQERLFGNYEDGRFGWVLRDIVRLPVPIPARGYQGFWEWKEADAR